MATYTLETKAYEFDEWDEENDCPVPGKVAGYTVFSTIRINPYTFVRAVVESADGTPAHPRAREWFVEWKATFGVSHSTQRMTGKMTRAQALREGEHYAAMIPTEGFADMGAAGEFYAAHPPSGPTYGH